MAQQKGGKAPQPMGRGPAQSEKRGVVEQGKGPSRGAEGRTSVEPRKEREIGDTPGKAKGGKFSWS